MSTNSKNGIKSTMARRDQKKSKPETSSTRLDSTRNVKAATKGNPKHDPTQTPNSTEAKDRLESRTLVKQGVKKATQPSQKPLKSTPRSTSKDNVTTPSSKRVIKTQFFPSKTNYADMLQHLDKYVDESGDATPRKLVQKSNSKKTETVQNRLRKPSVSNSTSRSPRQQSETRNVKKPNIVQNHLRQSSDLNSTLESPRQQLQKSDTKKSETVQNLLMETKQVYSASDSNSTSERPRTSTLKKGRIVNQNIVGPEVPIIRYDETKSLEPEEDDNVEYEDDFESYESDFENCSSSDSTIHNISEISTESSSSSSSNHSKSNLEAVPHVSADKDVEKKLDSGNFDLSDSKKKKEFVDLVDQDKMKVRTPENYFKSNLTSLSDEGFEEAKSLQFLNFAGAKKEFERKKSLEIRKKRGEELLNMIRLDNVNFTIFDVAPVPYEKYIMNFGNLNSVQVGVQTGEENVDDDMQTDEIVMSNKWVQMPPYISNTSLDHYKFERLGVGPDEDETLKGDASEKPIFNEFNLGKFLTTSGGLVLNLLKDQISLLDRMKNETVENSFSDGFVQYKPPSELLGKRKISCASFSPINPSVFLSVHVDECNEDYSKSMVYVWNMNDVVPESYLTCYGRISSCSFGYDHNTVFAGLENGILVVWEMKQNESMVENLFPMLEGDVPLKCPSFLTEIQNSHSCRVVAIQSVLESNSYDVLNSDVEQSKRVCSLDQNGDIIVWSVVPKHQLDIKEIKGLAHWGKIILYKNLRISLKNALPTMADLFCSDMIISNSEPKSALVATNYGNIVRCALNNERTNIKIYSSEDSSSTKCLASCPFCNLYFLAGFDDGNIHLYSVKNTKPLTIVSNKECEDMDAKISGIEWSSERPCTFYTRNAKNTIDIWDLSKSTIFPMESVPFRETITSMKLSPAAGAQHDKVYLMISTETSIHMHLLGKDHRKDDSDTGYQEEMRTFLNYVSRL